MQLEETKEIFLNKIITILGDLIGNFTYPDGQTGIAVASIPHPVYGSDFPQAGTTLEDGKIGVAIKFTDWCENRLDSIYYKLTVSVYTNHDSLLIYKAIMLLENSSLPIVGEMKLKSSSTSPIAKCFLFFDLLVNVPKEN